MGRRARHRASTLVRSIRRLFRRLGIVGTLVAALTVSTFTAIAGPGFAISAPTSVDYDAVQNGFQVSGITITDPPAYIQVGLTLTNPDGSQVEANDQYRIASGTTCSFDSTWVNSSTSGEVNFSGDDSPNLVMAGSAEDVQAALANVWIYAADSAFCSAAGTNMLAASLNTRHLKVTAVESYPGVFWSPSTQHYYQLATNQTNDGLGQPTDGSGNITDASRYFVKWTTARAAAKSATLTIGGQNHRGYLAAITTKGEFQFLNNNVTGGRGTIYPAWVGGTDQNHEGIWKWVDGPEAANFGGDSILGLNVGVSGTVLGNNYVATGTDSNGLTYYQRADASFFFVSNLNGEPSSVWDSSQFWSWDLILAYKANGEVMNDLSGVAMLIDTMPCYSMPLPPEDDVRFEPGEFGWVTPDGAALHCGWNGSYPVPYLTDNWGNSHYPDETAVWPLLDIDGNYILDSNGYLRQVNTGDITLETAFDPAAANFEGATFWGPDQNQYGGICNKRGARGNCQVTQANVNSNVETNSYYVYWSNGSNQNGGYWDGFNFSYGDGIYSPQPDNAGLSPSNDENALIINWCAKNAGIVNTNATTQTLYGNPGYYCTPGWNDLPAGEWNNTGTGTDSPNNIGTTDYVIEYCGYQDENSCAAPSAQVATISFNIIGTVCPAGGNPDLSASYAAAGVMTTDLTSATMATETFDSEAFSLGSNNGGSTAVGTISGTFYVQDANVYGGSGGTGKYPSPQGAGMTVNLTADQKYLGFWWSAGSSDNHVEFLDANDHIVACFNAQDLVTTLSAAANYSDYLGNPVNRSWAAAEPFAYVHLRLPTGFSKVHFYGSGFEFDSMSVSQTVPVAGSGETYLNGPPASVTQHLPPEIPVDPRALQVTLPQLEIGGAADATLCYRQVSDATGNPLVTASDINFGTLQSMAVELAGPYFSLYGTLSQVKTNTSSVVVGRNDYNRLMVSGPLFIEVAALPSAATPTEALCDSANTRGVFKLRPLDLFETLHRAISIN